MPSHDAGADDSAVHYHFPVEVEVRAGYDGAAHYHFPVEIHVTGTAASDDEVAGLLDRFATELGA